MTVIVKHKHKEQRQENNPNTTRKLLDEGIGRKQTYHYLLVVHHMDLPSYHHSQLLF